MRFGRSAPVSAILLAVLGLATPLSAQSAAVAVDQENFRAAPGGSILAELVEGTPLAIGESQGQWREAILEAWIWGRSVREQRRDGHDLVVNADGENLRATPNGRRLGRARGGMLLDRVEDRGDWVRVRRAGWIWEPSIRIDPSSSADETEAADETEEVEPADASGTVPETPANGGERGQVALGEQVSVASSGVLLDGPAGDTVARVRPGTRADVLATEGEWSRIRVEGWILTGMLGTADTSPGEVLRGISRDSIQAHPEVFRGRIIEWTVQFIAVQYAERFRTDFLEGEPFILARGPGDEPGFVYIAVRPEQLAGVQQLTPLARIRVRGRIRSARSALTGAPVLELLAITNR